MRRGFRRRESGSIEVRPVTVFEWHVVDGSRGTGMARPDVGDRIDAVYRTESRRVLATLIRLLGDFDLAEEAMHDAFAAALERWPRDGVPANPRAWLISTARFKAHRCLRRRATRSTPSVQRRGRTAASSAERRRDDDDR